MKHETGDVRLIRRLLRAKEYRTLARRESDFNLFRLFDEVIVENSWSALLAYLFDSERDHDLGQSPFRIWLRRVVSEADDPKVWNFIRRLPPASASTCRTRYQWRTPGGRFLDLIVEVIGSDGDVRSVLGIEVKVDAGEQEAQLRDYQTALEQGFPAAQKCIVFLCPTKRPPRTDAPRRNCPCFSASYETVSSAGRTLREQADGTVELLFSALDRRMGELASEENGMRRDIQKLVNKLLKDKNHRKAIGLLVESAPTLRLICERIRNSIEDGIEVLPASSRPASNIRMETYPQSVQNPREIKVHFRELDDLSDGFYLMYMLHSPDDIPRVGSCFTLRLSAWCETAAGRKRVRRLRDSVKLPPDLGARRQWHQWEAVWTGYSYRLADLGPKDIKGLSSLFVRGIKSTYGTLRAALRRRR